MCTLCPDLSISIDGTECKQCPLGMIANQEKTHCEFCKFGEYIDPKENKCKKCNDEEPIVNSTVDGCVKACDSGYGPNLLNICKKCQ